MSFNFRTPARDLLYLTLDIEFKNLRQKS